jgi:hypothetical protein
MQFPGCHLTVLTTEPLKFPSCTLTLSNTQLEFTSDDTFENLIVEWEKIQVIALTKDEGLTLTKETCLFIKAERSHEEEVDMIVKCKEGVQEMFKAVS